MRRPRCFPFLFPVLAACLLGPPDAGAQQVRTQAEDYTDQGGIRTEDCRDVGGGLNIAFIGNGDWAEYAIDVPAPGAYQLDFRVASNSVGGAIEILADGAGIGSVDVVGTGGWQTWETVGTVVTFSSGGAQTLRLNFTGESGISLLNVNWFTMVQAPLNVEAEDYTAHSGVEIEAGQGETTDSIGYIDDGDWAEYLVDLPEAGAYLVTF